MTPSRGQAAGPIVLADNRQLQRGMHVVGLFLMVWGGMFGGIPLSMLLSGGVSGGGSGWMFLIFPLLGFAAFFGGLSLILTRKEVRLDASRTRVEECKYFLGSRSVVAQPRERFDRVDLVVETGRKGHKSYKIALCGAQGALLPLGEFSERNAALTAGMRAARVAGLVFEEKRDAGQTLRLLPADLAKVPAAPSPEERPWWQRPSALALVAANLVPVLGVLYWGWPILSVMLLFWLENVIVGLFTLARMLLARGATGGSGASSPAPFAVVGNLFIAAFFTFHYGMFCAVHGGFIVGMFGGDQRGAGGFVGVSGLPQFAFDIVLRQGLLWAAIALVASHGVSFYTHYLKPRAYEDAEAGKIMFDPYKRVVILHVVILAGGFAAKAVGASVAPMLLLIALKIAVDLASHRREHAVPYEREMRDFMTAHGQSFVRADAPIAAAGLARTAAAVSAVVADRNDRPLAHYMGSWRADPAAAVPTGWITRAEFLHAASGIKVKLWSQAGQGLAEEGEFAGLLRGNAERVEFIEVRQQIHGRTRLVRFTGADAGENHIDLNEIQHPEGDPKAMQAKSLTLQRA